MIPGTRRRDGFTIIEMLAVVTVIALALAVSVPQTGLLGHRELQHAAEAMTAELELARERAIVTGAPHRVAIDLDQGVYHLERWEVPPAAPAAPPDPRAPIDLTPPQAAAGSFAPSGIPQQLPDSVRISRVETPAGYVEWGAVGVEFDRDGTATPAVLTLAGVDGAALALEILPLADTIRIHEVE